MTITISDSRVDSYGFKRSEGTSVVTENEGLRDIYSRGFSLTQVTVCVNCLAISGKCRISCCFVRNDPTSCTKLHSNYLERFYPRRGHPILESKLLGSAQAILIAKSLMQYTRRGVYASHHINGRNSSRPRGIRGQNHYRGR